LVVAGYLGTLGVIERDRGFLLLLPSAVRNHRGGEHPAHPQRRTAEPRLRLSDAPNPHESRAVVSCQSLCGLRVFHRLRAKRRHLRSSPRICVGPVFSGIGRVRCAVGHCACGQLCVRSAGQWWAERCRLTTRSTRTPTGGAPRLGGRRLPWFVRRCCIPDVSTSMKEVTMLGTVAIVANAHHGRTTCGNRYRSRFCSRFPFLRCPSRHYP
jgi:hypothetical protein